MSAENKYLKISKKYKYLGYTYLSIPSGWQDIVADMLVRIDKTTRPWYIPRVLLNWLHWLGTGGSVVRVRSWFWFNIFKKLYSDCAITDIKDKYAGLRVYYSATDEVSKIIEDVIETCDKTCEGCGSTKSVKVVGKGWMYNICKDCRKNYKL
jgi:hypothetical protein